MADDASWSAGAEAVGEAPRRARVTYSDEIGQEICDRLVAGESLMAICRDPQMPHRTTVREWGWRHSHFGEGMLQAIRFARVRRRKAELKRAMIPRDNRGLWSSYTPGVAGEICRRLAGGDSLIAICRGEGMPHYSTVLNWARAIPEFGDAYAEARRLAADWLFDEAREIAVATTPASERADRLRFDILRWQAARIAPRKYLETMVVAAAMDERLAEKHAAIEAGVQARTAERLAGRDWKLGGGEEDDEDEAVEAEVVEAEAVEAAVEPEPEVIEAAEVAAVGTAQDASNETEAETEAATTEAAASDEAPEVEPAVETPSAPPDPPRPRLGLPEESLAAAPPRYSPQPHALGWMG
jgi:hypothetical protein